MKYNSKVLTTGYGTLIDSGDINDYFFENGKQVKEKYLKLKNENSKKLTSIASEI